MNYFFAGCAAFSDWTVGYMLPVGDLGIIGDLRLEVLNQGG